jgi:hypothetical protein
MTKPRLLATLLLLPALVPPSALGQDQPAPSPAASAPSSAASAVASADAAAPSPAIEARDDRLSELQALVPEQLAGLALHEHLQLATGERLSEQMTEQERALLEDMLAANGKSFDDYAAANVQVPVTETEVVVLQAHRIRGIDAAATLATWTTLLGLDAIRQRVVAEELAGHEVLLLSDAARRRRPPLHLFAAGDVVWMMVARDEALVEEAVRVIAGEGDDPAAAQ